MPFNTYRIKLFAYSALVLATFFYTPIRELELPVNKVKEILSQNLINNGEFKEELDVNGKTFHVDYTIKKKYQKFLNKLLPITFYKGLTVF